ncbi:MAG: hypothetical protein ACREBR_02540, partial [bacterium]
MSQSPVDPGGGIHQRCSYKEAAKSTKTAAANSSPPTPPTQSTYSVYLRVAIPWETTSQGFASLTKAKHNQSADTILRVYQHVLN